MISFVAGSRLRFVYTNCKGEQATRQCIVESIAVGATKFHPDVIQFFLNGIDLDKKERRSYAMADIDASSMEVF